MGSEPSPHATSQDADSEAELWAQLDELEDDSDVFSGLPSPPPSPLKRKIDDDAPGPANAKVAKITKEPENTISFFTTSCPASDDVDNPFFIAGFGDPKGDNMMPSLSTGVKWELARLVSRKAVTHVAVDRLDELKGSSQDAAPYAAETLTKGGVQRSSRLGDKALAAEQRIQSPWAILDLEEDVMAANPDANLGNNDDFPGYGGKVCFAGTLVLESSKYSVHLDRCTIGPSCRLYRQYGSSSFLRIRVPSKVLHGGDRRVQQFFLRPFVIFDRVFRAFFSKEGRVLLFKTNEQVKNNVIADSTGTGLSLYEFINGFNPLELNSKQLLCKWSSRFALGLSSSVPGPVVLPDCVEEIDDIVASTDSVMTDGCGLSNFFFNLKLQHDFKLETLPCAVQVRQGGRKGMLLLVKQSNDSSNASRIAFRKDSQVKIVYDHSAQAHLANSTVDLLRVSRTKTPARLSAEVMINLEHNGVPADVLVRFQATHLAAGVESLLSWAKTDDKDLDSFQQMAELYRAVEKSENVYAARRFRELRSDARIHGFEQHEEVDDVEDDTFEAAVQERSVAWWPDYISGCPSSLAETVMALLDSGFTPQSLPVLRDKLKQMARTKILFRTQNFNFDIPQSAAAFVVPDYLGILGPDEIHFKSSRREFVQAEGPPTDIVLGDVLMTRNPCKVPSDVRKIKAVRCPEYHDIVDVIICSVQGQRRLLDFLAGGKSCHSHIALAELHTGDYDGDRCIVIWDSEVVVPFRNAPDEFSVKPPAVDLSFTRDSTTVAKFLADNVGVSQSMKAHRLQKYLLAALRDPSALGQFSGYHDNAVLTRGYDDSETVRVAYTFNTILDAAKTGHVLKVQARKDDATRFSHAEGPTWKSAQKPRSNFASVSNTPPLQRKIDPNNPSLCRRFIMDVLVDAAVEGKDRGLCELEKLFSKYEARPPLDADLVAPWDNYVKFAAKRKQEGDTRPHEDLLMISTHVEEMLERHRKEIRSTHGFTNLPIEVRQDTLRNLSRDFSARPSVDELQTIPDTTLVARLRASCAYRHDHEQHRSGHGWSRFPWNVAFRDLCDIKAAALGPHKISTTAFYESFRLKRP